MVRVSGGSGGGGAVLGTVWRLAREDRLARDPIHLEHQPGLVQRLQVDELLSLRRVDHVARVADIDVAAVRAVQERAEAAAVWVRARILVAGERLREPDVVEVARRRSRDSTDVVDVRDAVRRVEHPELAATQEQRKAVIGRIGPEPRIPRKARKGDPPFAERLRIEDGESEHVRTRRVDDRGFGVDSRNEFGWRGGRSNSVFRVPGREVDERRASRLIAHSEPAVWPRLDRIDPPDPAELHRADELVAVVDRVEAERPVGDDEQEAMAVAIGRRSPLRRAGHEAGRNLLATEVGGQADEETGRRADEQRDAKGDPLRHWSSARSRGMAAASAASASSNRHRPRSGSSTAFEIARTSTAGTPASAEARSTPNPSIASTSQSTPRPT